MINWLRTAAVGSLIVSALGGCNFNPERQALRKEVTAYKSAVAACVKDVCAAAFANNPPCLEMVRKGEQIRKTLNADIGLTNTEIHEIMKLTNIEHRAYIRYVNWTYDERIYPDPLCEGQKRAWEG